jgi:hypothetical protein
MWEEQHLWPMSTPSRLGTIVATRPLLFLLVDGGQEEGRREGHLKKYGP